MEVKIRAAALTLAAAMALLFAGGAFAAAGDVIRTFTLEGQPAQGVRGLAYDWSDGNVWAAGPRGQNDVLFGKFDPASASVVGSWRAVTEPFWCYDIAYGYVISATPYLVLLDGHRPRIRLYTTAGSYYGTLPDPFPDGYNEGCACDGPSNLYLTNYRYKDVYWWNGSTWKGWAKVPGEKPEGVAAGWGRVFVVTAASDYKIYEFGAETGSLQRSIPLNNWGTRYMVGMSIGRVNAKGGEESVFLAIYYPSSYICEVSVGDVTGAAVAPASLGKVKALFK
jgi:hypothetical protein